MDRDWEEGLPWLLLALREVTQESTGFSPNELVFGHTVRGPLNLLYEQWKDADPPGNLIDYVNGFCHRLYAAGLLAKENLVSAQGKMKTLYDRRAEQRVFSEGDWVLALLPTTKVSKFDLLKGYWQVPLSEHARELSAFITPNGLYAYNIMPFGL